MLQILKLLFYISISLCISTCFTDDEHGSQKITPPWAWGNLRLGHRKALLNKILNKILCLIIYTDICFLLNLVDLNKIWLNSEFELGHVKFRKWFPLTKKMSIVQNIYFIIINYLCYNWPSERLTLLFFILFFCPGEIRHLMLAGLISHCHTHM